MKCSESKQSSTESSCYVEWSPRLNKTSNSNKIQITETSDTDNDGMYYIELHWVCKINYKKYLVIWIKVGDHRIDLVIRNESRGLIQSPIILHLPWISYLKVYLYTVLLLFTVYSVDTIKKEVLIMGEKMTRLQCDIKIILEELKSIQILQTPTPRPSTSDDSNNITHTYLVINENKE